MAAQEVADAPLTVSEQNGSLVVAGTGLTGGGTWSAQSLGDKRILLVTDEAKTGVAGTPAGMASCAIEVFKDFLLGLHQACFSGMVAVDTGYGMKRVFFSKGAIVFAASNIMDDRLGEVIYREACISLDELTNSTAHVTKSRKFGQVLIANGIFSNVQLWQALKLQVKQILRSLFMVDWVFFEMQSGHGAPTEVIFMEPTSELVSECYGFGCAFRNFLGKLRADSAVELLVPRAQAHQEHKPGTFSGDLLELIEQQNNVQDLLNASKLIDSYTVAALFHLVNQGLCKITPEVEDSSRPPALMGTLKAKFDAYTYVLQAVKKAFAESAKEFPMTDLRGFAASLNPEGFPSIYLDAQGGMGRDCLSGIITQCSANAARVAYFVVRLESLVQFLLQIAGDNLAYQAASRIRADYRAVTA